LKKRNEFILRKGEGGERLEREEEQPKEKVLEPQKRKGKRTPIITRGRGKEKGR